MTDEIKEKLQVMYNDIISPCTRVYEVVSEYFTEDLTDFQVAPFRTFLDAISSFTVDSVLQSLYVDLNIFCDTHGIPVSILHDSAALAMPAVNSSYANILMDNLTSTFKEAAMGSRPVILIRFPRVRVTNENNRYIDIEELYVRVPLTWSGTMSGTMSGAFEMVRTSYDIVQWLSGYSHSHLPSIGSFPSFRAPCLGSGPIRSTMRRLSDSCNLDIWGLFCFELAKYVTVESLAGGPYFRLENVGDYGDYSSSTPSMYRKEYVPNVDIDFKGFINYFVGLKNMKFAYSNGAYTLGESPVNFWVRVSNEFIKWYNYQYSIGAITYTLDELIDRGILVQMYVAGGKAYTVATNNRVASLGNSEGQVVLTFKGVDRHLTITGNNSNSTNNSSLLVSMNLCDYIISTILKLINCNYGREEKGETKAGKKCQYV